MPSESDALRAERDELLEALTRVLDEFDRGVSLSTAREAARAAIAKTEAHSIQVGNDPPTGA